MSVDIQNVQVLKKLRKSKGGITQKTDADNWTPAVARPAARVKDLRIAGHRIETVLVKNSHNRGSHARYFLIKEATNDQHS